MERPGKIHLSVHIVSGKFDICTIWHPPEYGVIYVMSLDEIRRGEI